MSNLIYGIGFNDNKYPTEIKGKITREYRLWSNMLRRCYCTKSRKYYSTYTDCTVSNNFKNYTYFYEWAQVQVGFNFNDWYLDKDILVKGNKEYAENKCVFVPSELNNFFTDAKTLRGKWPLGVTYYNPRKKFRALCAFKGSQKYLGCFDTPEEAHQAYKHFKEFACKQLAYEWKSLIDGRVYTAMLTWQV